MILTIEEIKDYQYCPKMYYYNHVEKLKPNKTSNIEKYAYYSLKQTYHWYFNERLNHNSPGLLGLKKKFSELFMFDRTYTETMFLDVKSKASVLEKRCAKALTNFYEIFGGDLGEPLLINKDYELEFGNVKVAGTIPVIRETKLKEIEMLNFTRDIIFGSHTERNLQIEVQRDIEIIASSMAFKKVYGWDIDRHMAYSTYFNDVNFATVDGPMMLNFENIVKSVAKCIHNKIFYPVYNSKCSTCIYRQTCLKEW